MKVHVLRSDILEAMQRVQYSASGKGIMPILSGVKIDCSDGAMELSATDLESYTVTGCEANVEETGACVVNMKTFLEYLRGSGDERLAMECTANELKVQGEKSTVRLYVMPVEDFPARPEVDIPVLEEMQAGEIFRAVSKVSRAASKDEKRPTLMGVYMEVAEGEVRLVSTDSYRLAIEVLRGGFKVREEGDYIIPAASLVNLARAAGREGSLNIWRDENRGQLRFDVDGITHMIRLIEGKFPKYGQFIPEETNISIEADKKGLLDALKRISLISSTVKITAKEGVMLLEGESREVGEGKEEVETVHTGEEINIAFNTTFLEDGIQSLEGEKVVLGLNEPLKPGVVKEKDGREFTYVIMPIRM
ncbi:MAG: DNA polymerase III subunit beta [Actinobacteria bacterium]|nr:DNA polymerase III subunit beta [Actinomycetota bacterium]